MAKQTHIFKLADWGCGKMNGSIENTILPTNSCKFTENYAAPEILQNQRIYLDKADIYSLGLCILCSCGIKSNEFKYLSFLPNSVKHEKDLKECLNNHKIKERYGLEIYEMLLKMLSFNPKDRISSQEVLNLMKNITRAECLFCDKTHSFKISLKGCNHILGKICLKKFIIEILDKNLFYIPKCPICDCQIPKDQLIEIIDKEIFDMYFYKCKCCKTQTYFNYYLKMENCSHIYCFNCFDEFSTKSICPVESCKKPLGAEVLKEFEVLKKKCLKCHKLLTNDDLSMSLECCGQMRFCKECFQNEISSELDTLNKDKKESLICFINKSLELMRLKRF